MKGFWIVFLCLAICLPFPGLATEYLVSDSDSEPTASQAAALAGGPEIQSALASLQAGSLLDALNAFAKLGTLDDANRYAAYAQALLCVERDDPEAAAALFSSLSGFLDSDYQLALTQAARLHRFSENGQFGYVDAQGAWKIAPQFDWAQRVFRLESAPEHTRYQADYAPEDLYLVAEVFRGDTSAGDTDTEPEDGSFGLVRNDGVVVAPLQYDAVLWTVNGVAAMEGANGVTLYNIATCQTIGAVYEDVGDYAGGYIPVQLKGQWGYLDPKTGTYLGAGCVWDSALPFSEGRAGVSLDGKYGFLNASGTAVIDLTYKGVTSFHEGYAGVLVRNRWGFINKAGIVVIEPEYTAVQGFQYGVCAVERGGSWGLIDTKNNTLLRIKYSEITSFDPIYRRAWIRQNKLWGLVSTTGAIVLKPTWQTYDDFNGNTLSRVSYKKRYSYIDCNGKARITGQFVAAAPFTADYGAVLASDKTVQYLNKLQRGFTLATDVPVECREGFIEGRTITEVPTSITDAGRTYVVLTRTITYALYDSEGKAIPVSASGQTTQSEP